ncbi:hypothetical protein M427DRAFT_132757 [Gonapodya prolifera JEL478]|uniref:N-acetyltransferase domain-containing protein n=1 Tax=Gonapodya prolifera (strain JEL478) TaxID=1344416 RepID=A0A139ANU2_GONPJ|nr:hypothetical protein M427DRAFT_132757 [Gonapodya prolifera JEL478]|eukprot:KXS18402.1 hypothetical protein M427DRAFT_132757 [Gonapodya prolifera JEL478]
MDFSSVPFESLPIGVTDEPSNLEDLPVHTQSAILHHFRYLLIAERRFFHGDLARPLSIEAAREELTPASNDHHETRVGVVSALQGSSKELAGIVKIKIDFKTGKCTLNAWGDPARGLLLFGGLFKHAVVTNLELLKGYVSTGKFVSGVVPWLDFWVDSKVSVWDPIAAEAGFIFARVYKVLRKDLNGDLDVSQSTTDAAISSMGFRIVPYVSEHDAQSVWQCQQEAFRDHYGHIEDQSFSDWIKDVEGPGQGYNPELFTVAWTSPSPLSPSPKVVGGVLAYDRSYTVEGKAFVYLVFVRKEFRQKGLGSALLQLAFAKLRERGYDHLTLSVDTESKTNAGAIYDRAGMYRVKESCLWRKTLL